MAAETNVVRVAENIEVVEFTVTIASTPRPEAVLFDTIATYLASASRRRSLMGATLFYDSEGDTPILIGVLFLGEPMQGP